MSQEEEDEQQRLYEDTTLGCQLAALAILNDDTERLEKESFGFWHKHAVLMIIDSFDRPEEWKKGLTHVLKTKFDLETDKIIDIDHYTPNHKVINLQGYIAHNDDMVVISFQGTASIRDNFINVDFLTSVWEVDKDGPQGFAGHFSAFEWRNPFYRWRKNKDDEQPPLRVHTGFYNNFLAAIPHIKEHVESLIGPDQPPRKIMVCGHSLGGAIATLTGIYLWQQYDWNDNTQVPQHLVMVSMGAPRPCQTPMAKYLDQELQKERGKKNVTFIRVQRNKDAIPHLPLIRMGFQHFPHASTFLTGNNDIDYLEDNVDDKIEIEEKMVREADDGEAPKPRVFCQVKKRRQQKQTADQQEIERLSVHPEEKSLWKMAQGFPLAARDHFPSLYLVPFRNKSPSKFSTRQLSEATSAEDSCTA